jgi:hypothetical protein
VYTRNAHARHIQPVVPKPKPDAEDVAPPAAPPKEPPPLPNMEGFAASPLGLLRLLPPNADAPGVAPPPPKRPPPGLLAGVFEAAPPKGFDAPAVAPPPNNEEPLPGVLVLAVPNMDGVDPPDVLLAAPNNGLLGVLLLPCCPKLKPDMLCSCGGLMRVVWW